jgi:hypothetical protein
VVNPTPGPWEANVESAGDVFAGDLQIADCDFPQGELSLKVIAANARLASAAPDLLAACRMWDEGFVDGEEFDEKQFLEWVNKNRRAARAAIAKAEGTP